VHGQALAREDGDGVAVHVLGVCCPELPHLEDAATNELFIMPMRSMDAGAVVGQAVAIGVVSIPHVC